MGQIKEEEFINITYLKNSEALENIKKELANLKIEKTKLIEKKEKINTVINNFQESINYWTTQNNNLKNRIVHAKNQIVQLKKQKINKIKNFFITFFSFGQINKNKTISDLIQTEKRNYDELHKTKLDNQKKINFLMLDIIEQNTKQTNLINNANNIFQNENKLLEEKHKLLEEKSQILITLMNYEKNEWQKKAVVEVNEKMVEQYESEIFELNEKKCKLEQQLSISSDEGFNSTTTSTESLHAGDPLPLNKQTKLQITRTNEREKSAKPWEQTLRQYDYPTNYQQKRKQIVSLK